MGKLCTRKAEKVYDKEEGSQPDRETIFTGRKWQKRRKQRCLPWMKYGLGAALYRKHVILENSRTHAVHIVRQL